MSSSHKVNQVTYKASTRFTRENHLSSFRAKRPRPNRFRRTVPTPGLIGQNSPSRPIKHSNLAHDTYMHIIIQQHINTSPNTTLHNITASHTHVMSCTISNTTSLTRLCSQSTTKVDDPEPGKPLPAASSKAAPTPSNFPK